MILTHCTAFVHKNILLSINNFWCDNINGGYEMIHSYKAGSESGYIGPRSYKILQGQGIVLEKSTHPDLHAYLFKQQFRIY